MAKLEYGEGTIFQRCERRYGCPDLVDVEQLDGSIEPERPKHACKGRWYAYLEKGWTDRGTRDRQSVSSKTRAETARKLRDLRKAKEDGSLSASRRMTVKQWAETYLELRKQPPNALSPNGWNAAASPIRKWVVSTIGHKQLVSLTPADIRAVDQAQYDAGRKTSTADATRRALNTMLNWAVDEGHAVPERVRSMPRPGMGVSDRTDLTIQDTLACLEVASWMDDGIRWVLALLYGARQGEVLGLCEFDPIDGHPLIDWDAGIITLEWQLQDLQCVIPRKPEHGYRIPRDYEAVQVAGMYHLVRPKSKKGFRELPLIEPVAEALRAWIDIRPKNKLGLVFPNAKGGPTNDKIDREEWWAIQQTAAVIVDPADEHRILGMNPDWRGHPSGSRWYHIHECRNTFATKADETGASDVVTTSLIGHASIRTTRGYQTAHRSEKRLAVERIAERMLPTATDDVPPAGAKP